MSICLSKSACVYVRMPFAHFAIAQGSWIKPGAVVLDVGINSVPDATKKSGYRLTGDVEFEEAKKVRCSCVCYAVLFACVVLQT